MLTVLKALACMGSTLRRRCAAQARHTTEEQLTDELELGPKSKLRLPQHLLGLLHCTKRRRSDVERAMEAAAGLLLAARWGLFSVPEQTLLLATLKAGY